MAKMANFEEEMYLDCLLYILDEGEEKEDRTGTGTYSVFGGQDRYELYDNTIPLITTKKVHWKSVVHELLWFLKGGTNIEYLNDNGVSIWDEWADENGDLGPVYGKQWREWEGSKWYNNEVVEVEEKDGHLFIPISKTFQVDQIKEVIESIKTNPASRRHIVSAWNVGQLSDMALAPCHMMFQFNVRQGKYLDCQMYQRSADMFLGVPFNIASYSLLTHMVAHVTGLQAGEFIHTVGDAHIYKNHLAQVREQLTRKPYSFPQIKLNPKIKNIDDFTFDDIELIGYEHHPAITAEVAV